MQNAECRMQNGLWSARVVLACAVGYLLTMVGAVCCGQCQLLPDGTWSCGPGQTTPEAQPTAMDIRVECPTARGSGTAIDHHASGGTLVLTNYHVIKDQSQVTLHNGQGLTSTARVVETDDRNDLAILWVPVTWPHVNLGNEVVIGTPVQFRAYDSGLRFRKYYGNVQMAYTANDGSEPGYFASGASRSGNSGGGVYSRGRLVGVVWGNPSGGTAFIRIGPVRRLLNRALNRQVVVFPQQPSGPPSTTPEPAPALPPVPSPQPPTPAQPCNCQDRWAELDARLASLDELLQRKHENLAEIAVMVGEQEAEQESLKTWVLGKIGETIQDRAPAVATGVGAYQWVQPWLAWSGAASVPLSLAVAGFAWWRTRKRNNLNGGDRASPPPTSEPTGGRGGPPPVGEF